MPIDRVNVDELEPMAAPELLRFALERFGSRAAIGTSGQKTGVVILDLACKLGLDFHAFCIDTLLLPRETHKLLDELEQRYGIRIERFRPDPNEVKELERMFGRSAHYFNRELCCRVRKTRPLGRALTGRDVWISGLRRDQSAHRRDNARRAAYTIEPTGRRILKLNPLVDWTDEQVEAYTRRHELPYNRLYDYVSEHGERYKVLGCACCHVPVPPAMDKRMGKFPWEKGVKECGLHERGGGI